MDESRKKDMKVVAKLVIGSTVLTLLILGAVAYKFFQYADEVEASYVSDMEVIQQSVHDDGNSVIFYIPLTLDEKGEYEAKLSFKTEMFSKDGEIDIYKGFRAKSNGHTLITKHRQHSILTLNYRKHPGKTDKISINGKQVILKFE